MSKLNNVIYIDDDTGEILSPHEIEAVRKEEERNKIRRLFQLLRDDPNKLTLEELGELRKISKLKSNIKLDFKKDSYFTVKNSLDFIKGLSIHTRGVIYTTGHMITHDGRLKYNNNRLIPSFEALRNHLNVSSKVWSKYVKPDIDKYSLIKKSKIDNNWCLLINPTYTTHQDFEWYKEIFDLFEDSIKESFEPFEYLKIKAKWYDVSHEIVVTNFKDLSYGISGIYRLYKDDEIVYIGKSKNIKARIISHMKDKDIDYFDFTILDNESDKNLYEIYYIDKYKSLLNKDCLEISKTNVELREVIFSNRIKL